MEITIALLNELTEKAKASSRLRISFDLRNTPNDNSQRSLNVMEPGTIVAIHRHRTSSETASVIRGSIRLNFYNDAKELIDSYVVAAKNDIPFYLIPKMTWHNCEVLESGTIIFEAKDGMYFPLSQEDIIE